MLLKDEYQVFTTSEALFRYYSDTINTIGKNPKYTLQIGTIIQDNIFVLNIKIHKKENMWIKEGYFSFN